MSLLPMIQCWLMFDAEKELYGVAENKYYARGVGLVLEVVVEGGSGRIELVEIFAE